MYVTCKVAALPPDIHRAHPVCCASPLSATITEQACTSFPFVTLCVFAYVCVPQTYDNQRVTYMMIEPHTGFAPGKWQQGVGSAVLVRADRKPLPRQHVEVRVCACVGMCAGARGMTMCTGTHTTGARDLSAPDGATCGLLRAAGCWACVGARSALRNTAAGLPPLLRAMLCSRH